MLYKMIFLVFLSVLFILAIILWLYRPQKSRELNGKVVLLTGGSNGIGWAMAQRLSRLGMTVIIVDIEEPPLVTEQMQFYRVDVSDRQAVFELRRTLNTANICPSIVINNAGIARPGPFTSLEVERVMAVNCLGHFWLLQAFLPGMSPDGHVVCMASCLGLGAVPYLADYCASKAAVIALSESLRLEFPWLTVTVLCPFLVETRLFAQARLRFPWLLPPLKPNDIVREVEWALRHRHNGDIWLPRRLWLLPLVRLFPTSLYLWLMRWSGGCDALGIKAE